MSDNRFGQTSRAASATKNVEKITERPPEDAPPNSAEGSIPCDPVENEAKSLTGDQNADPWVVAGYRMNPFLELGALAESGFGVDDDTDYFIAGL